MTLESDNIRFMRIFAGIPGKGASYNSGVIENVFSRGFGRYVFGTLGNEANIYIRQVNEVNGGDNAFVRCVFVC